MWIRSVGFGLLTGLWLIAGGGCQKSSPSEASADPGTQPAAPKPAVPETVARLHWLGKKRLEGETNALFFMSIWDLPESSKLEAQTLDKLALALARSLSKDTNAASATNTEIAGIMRPLFDDLVKEESYFEVRSATNQPGELALAIRLNEDRAGFWETNLPKAFERVSATAPSGSHGWQVEFENQKSKIKNRIALARVGTWTLVTLSRWPMNGGPAPSAGLRNNLAERIQNSQPLFAASGTNFWLETDLDLGRVAGALACNWTLPAGIPRLSLTMIGDGLNVRTRGELTFPTPLGLEFEPWNIPTNLVHDPLVSFTAINGIRPWLAAFWTNLNIGTPPNQLYLWGMEGAAVETYFAAPLTHASNAVYGLSAHLMEACNPWLTTNKMGELARASDLNGFYWKGFPFVAPFLKSAVSEGTAFALGGLGPESPLTNAMPEGLIREVTSHANLLCYDWEVTGPRILGGIYTSQLLRVMMHKAQLPEKSSSMLWLKALSSKLGNSGTEISAPDPTSLSFIRKSGVGLTGVELHVLADWLESPAFPNGLHTVVAPAPPEERVAGGSIPR